MNAHPGTELTRLLKLLEKERFLLKNMDVLTREQSALLEKDEIESFNVSLDKRQAVIDEIDGLHQESEALMQSCMSKNDRLDEAEKIRIENREILSRSFEQNKKNFAAAQEIAEQYKNQRNKLSMSRKSIGLYVQGPVYEGEHFDKKT